MLTEVSRAVDRDRGWIEFAHSETSRQRLMEFLPVSMPGSAISANRGKSPELRLKGGARSLFKFRVRRADPVTIAEPSEAPAALPAATLAVVKTKTDDKHGWLAAGHAMGRIILQAQALGLAWGFFNQPVRRRRAREALRLQIGHKGFAQVILQLACAATVSDLRPEYLAVNPAASQW
jgi:hypothetical protein